MDIHTRNHIYGRTCFILILVIVLFSYVNAMGPDTEIRIIPPGIQVIETPAQSSAPETPTPLSVTISPDQAGTEPATTQMVTSVQPSLSEMNTSAAHLSLIYTPAASPPDVPVPDIIKGTSEPDSSNADTSLKSRFYMNGVQVDQREIGPGRPPAARVKNAKLPDLTALSMSTIHASEVPALYWSYGCSATSATMLFGYYDRNGYPNIYTGPTNGGIFPLTNALWGSSSEGLGECPLSASHTGIDGRSTNGSVDDYYRHAGAISDPYYMNWPQHSPPDSVGDFMGTSQYNNWNNADGATNFFFNPDGSALNDYTSSERASHPMRDGARGMKLFAQSRGYTVTSNYNQYIYGYHGNTRGFNFTQYKSEIDAGNPVLIHLSRHTILGVGYNEPDQIIVHDTWDYSSHTMTWGGNYEGMNHIGVTVIHLLPVANFTATRTSGHVPLTVSFTDTSGGNTTLWSWDFGDSDTTNATMQNPLHTYRVAGTYPVSLTVTNPNGSNTTTQAGYITAGALQITSIMPGSGPTDGGTPVTITGTGFTGATVVHFGSTAATTFTVVSDAIIIATSPAGTGTVDVTVTTADGTSATVSAADNFTYRAALNVDTAGLYQKSTGTFLLKNSNGGGDADTLFQYGWGGEDLVPMTGDWTGSGSDTIGLYQKSTGTFLLKNSNGGGDADTAFQYGGGGEDLVPLAGDWTGSGSDTAGLYQKSTGAFFLKNSNRGGAADTVFQYGWGSSTGDLHPMIGQWV